MVMYKIVRRGGGWGGVQKSYTRTDPGPLATALGPTSCSD